MSKTAEELAAEAEAQRVANEAKTAADAKAKAELYQKYLEGLSLSAEKLEVLKNDPALMEVFVHQVEAKRNANAEAKANRLELDKLKKLQEDADAKAKLEAGNFKELYESEKAKNEQTQAKLREARVQGELKALAVQKGIKKLEYLKLFDQTKLELDDEFNVKGLDSFDTFVKDNPELFGTKEEGKKIIPDASKPGITSTGNILDDLKALKEVAQKTQSASALAAYNRKLKECKEKKLI